MNRSGFIYKILEIILLLFGVILVYILCGINEKEERYSATFLDVFDTRTEIIGYATDKKEFSKKAKIIEEKLLFYNNLFDIYNDYEGINNIKTINDNAGVAPVKVDREIIELLLLSKRMYELSGGRINIAFGSVLSIWHDYREVGIEQPKQAKLPEIELLKEAFEHTDIDKVIINEEASTVYLADRSMSLDVGGIGKGYAVQSVAQYARENGISNMLLNVGGNICAIGEHIDGSMWKVGIQNPDLESENSYIEKITLRDGQSIVSSGNYQRYYTVDSVKYCHIINPETLFPADYFCQVSILTADSGYADALSTAVFNMSMEEGIDFINSLKDVEAMWVLADGSIYYSCNFKDYLIGDFNK